MRSEQSPQHLPMGKNEQQAATIEFLVRISRNLGRVPEPEELAEIAQRNAVTILGKETPEQRAKRILMQTLLEWGISPTSPNLLRANGDEIELTLSEFHLLRLFAKAPNHLLTPRAAQAEFEWQNSQSSFYSMIDRLRQKLDKLGTEAPIQLVNVRNVGYRIDETKASSPSDLGKSPPPQNPVA